MVADDPGRLLESNLVFHLSDPPAIKDTSWIKPGKTTFPWWNGYVLDGVDFEPGVNTATMKYYIDFCAEQGIPYHSLDGLDIAWYGGPIVPNGPTDITKAAPSIDLPEVLRYAKEKGVRLRLWMHWKALEAADRRGLPGSTSEWGIEGVMVDFMDRDDQEMVRFYHEMAEKAAKHHLTLTLHGAYKPTGMERTWPNVLTYEAALNQEYDKWEPPGVRGTPPGAQPRRRLHPDARRPARLPPGRDAERAARGLPLPRQGPAGPGDARAPAGDVRRLPESPADDGRLPDRLSRPARAGVHDPGPDDLGRDAGAARRVRPLPRRSPAARATTGTSAG